MLKFFLPAALFLAFAPPRTEAPLPDPTVAQPGDRPWWPVYEFSDSSYGIVVDLNWIFDHEVEYYQSLTPILDQDSFKKEVIGHEGRFTSAHNFQQVEKLPHGALYRNAKVSELYKHWIGQDFTLICDRGTVRVKVKDVLFDWDDCRSSFLLFRVTHIDKKYLGHPLFATQDHFRRFYFGPFVKTDAALKEWTPDYLSSLDIGPAGQLHAASKSDSLWFVYDDDFTWPVDGVNLFPGRLILVMPEGGSPRIRDMHFLDYYGMPCQ